MEKILKKFKNSLSKVKMRYISKPFQTLTKNMNLFIEFTKINWFVNNMIYTDLRILKYTQIYLIETDKLI